MFNKKIIKDQNVVKEDSNIANELGISEEILFNEALPDTISYTFDLNYDDVYRCLKKVYDIKGKKSRIIQFLLLIILFGMNLYYFITNPTDNKFCGLLAIIALGFGFYIGLMPYSFRKKEAKAQAERNRELTLSMNKQSFSVFENGERTNLAFSDIKTCYEDKDQYNLLLNSGKIFCVPKRKMPDQIKDSISQILSLVLQERYNYIYQGPKLK